MKKTISLLISVGVLIFTSSIALGGAFVGVSVAQVQLPQVQLQQAQIQQAQLQQAQFQTQNIPRFVPRDAISMKASFAPLVEEAAPAVVNIYTRRVVQTQARSPFADDPFFRQFFGDSGIGGAQERVQNSLGSGVIVRPDGIIVTNNHVIEGMTEIKVVLYDRREFEAELVLTDPQTDLAILRIKTPEKLAYLQFADSDAAMVGDIVLAIGNPFGVGQTVTNGIVSALARTQVGVTDYQFFIQTDAAINPGNSGGALVDVDGKLLGINSAIYSRSGGSNGIGFAIPGNLVKQVVASAIDGSGRIARPWLGVSADTVTSDMGKALNLAKPAGALIKDIFPGGPADRAGLKAGDVIVAVAGQEIYDSDAMRYRVATKDKNENIHMRYVRGGKERDVTVRLDVPPETPARKQTTLAGNNPLTGAVIANLSPAVNEELGRPALDSGVVVLDTDNANYARRYGLRKGSRILSVNGNRIASVDELNVALEDTSTRWIIQTEDTSGRVSTWRIGR